MLYEMIDLDQPIGDKTEEPLRAELFGEVGAYLQYLYYHIHGRDYVNFSGLSIPMRTQGHAVIWDHCQPGL